MGVFFCLLTLLYGSCSMELGKISHLHLKKVNTYVQANTDAVTHVDAYLKKVDTNVNQSRSPHSLLSENLIPRDLMFDSPLILAVGFRFGPNGVGTLFVGIGFGMMIMARQLHAKSLVIRMVEKYIECLGKR